MKPEETAAGTVLVVDDADAVRGLVRTVLELHGHRVLSAASPADALALAEEHAGDVALVLSDIAMPQMSGRRLAERLRGVLAGVPVLLMSGFDGEAADGRRGEPELPVIVKPFGVGELMHAVRGALAGAQPAHR